MSHSENGHNLDNAAHLRAKLTRRRILRWSAAGGAVGLGATLVASAPWRAAFGQAKPYKLGTVQPLTGVAASGGKTAQSGCKWRSTKSTNRAASWAGRSS